MPHADSPYSEKALSLARQGKIAEALDFYDLALEKSPDNDVILNNKAMALITVGRFEEALTLSRRAAFINPDSADIWINMSVSLQKLDRLSEAGDALEKAVAINPYDAYARALLGIIYQRLNQEDRAKDQNRQLQELIFPNEYAGFFFGTAVFLLGILLGGIRSVDAKPFEISILSQTILLIFFCLICVLYWKSLRKQQEVNRSVIVVSYSPSVVGDQSNCGVYLVLLLMLIVFIIGIITGGDVWNWMR